MQKNSAAKKSTEPLPRKFQPPQHNQFLFQQCPLLIDPPTLPLKQPLPLPKKDNSKMDHNCLLNRVNLSRSFKMKTEGGHSQGRALPELMIKKSSMGMKNDEEKKSENFIRSKPKNTDILNELIGILKQDNEPLSKGGVTKINRIKKKDIRIMDSRINQFLHEEKLTPTIYRGPKVIPTSIMKLYEPKPIPRRNIYSEDGTRVPINKQNLKYAQRYGQKQQKQKGKKCEELLTFYKGQTKCLKQRCFTEAIHLSQKQTLPDYQFQL